MDGFHIGETMGTLARCAHEGSKALEWQRRDKVIGSPLEAKVVLGVVPELYQLLQAADLSSLFIVSQVNLREVDSIPPKVTYCATRLGCGSMSTRLTAPNATVVGIIALPWEPMIDHPTLCDRCIEPVRKILNEAVR